VTALLQGGWIHNRAKRGFAGTFLQQDRVEIGDWGCWHGLALAKWVAPHTVVPHATGPASCAGCFPTALFFYSARSRTL